MSEERSDEVHKAIAREMEQEEHSEFLKWFVQNESNIDDSPPNEETDIERADWEHKWRDTPYDSYEDARHNVSHVGDPGRADEWQTEPDDIAPMSGESLRHRGSTTEDWGDPDSPY